MKRRAELLVLQGLDDSLSGILSPAATAAASTAEQQDRIADVVRKQAEALGLADDLFGGTLARSAAYLEDNQLQSLHGLEKAVSGITAGSLGSALRDDLAGQWLSYEPLGAARRLGPIAEEIERQRQHLDTLTNDTFCAGLGRPALGIAPNILEITDIIENTTRSRSSVIAEHFGASFASAEEPSIYGFLDQLERDQRARERQQRVAEQARRRAAEEARETAARAAAEAAEREASRQRAAAALRSASRQGHAPRRARVVARPVVRRASRGDPPSGPSSPHSAAISRPRARGPP